MARKRMEYINRGNKKRFSVLPSLVIVVVSLMVAAVGAFAWQSISGDDEKYLLRQEMLRSAQSKTESEEPSSQSSAAQGASTSESEDAQSVSQSDDSASSSTPQLEAKSALVPEGERVRSEYFDDAMFVGDSITDGIRSYELMQNATVISHTGINPDSIRTKAVYRDANGNLITMLQAMGQHPDAKKIYVMLGANSASWMDHDLFIQYYEEFLKSIQKQHPNAVLYVQSITPINEAKFNVNYSGQNLTNEKIAALNQDILEIAQRLNVYYLNVGESLASANGQLPDEATSDGLHFNTTYYQKWFDYLKTHTIRQQE